MLTGFGMYLCSQNQRTHKLFPAQTASFDLLIQFPDFPCVKPYRDHMVSFSHCITVPSFFSSSFIIPPSSSSDFFAATMQQVTTTPINPPLINAITIITPFLNMTLSFLSISVCVWGIGVLPKVRLDIQTLCLQNEYRQSLYHPADPPLIYFDSLICTSPSSVVQMIWSLSAILISVFIVPVTSFPHTTTIRHLRKRI